MNHTEGYLTVGQLARAMGSTARTLRHYDSVGLLRPEAVSPGGHRLYSYGDLVRLAEIQYLQSMGFALDVIRDQLLTPASREVFEADLTEKATGLRTQIEALTRSLRDVEALLQEVAGAGAVYLSIDVARSVDMITALRAGTVADLGTKGVPAGIVDLLVQRGAAGCAALADRWTQVWADAEAAIGGGQAPSSTRGLQLGEAYWGLLQELVGGEVALLADFDKQEIVPRGDPLADAERAHPMALEAWLMMSCDAYFEAVGIDPFEGLGADGAG